MRITEVINTVEKRNKLIALVFYVPGYCTAVSYLKKMCCRKRRRKLVFTKNNTKTRNHLVCFRHALTPSKRQRSGDGGLFFFIRRERTSVTSGEREININLSLCSCRTEQITSDVGRFQFIAANLRG